MPYEIAAKHVMLNAIRGAMSHASLHDGIPSKATEVKGGLYKRARVEFGSPSGGEIRITGMPVIDVPEGATVNHVGFWTSPIGGALLAYGRVEEQTFHRRGVYIIDGAKLDLNLS